MRFTRLSTSAASSLCGQMLSFLLLVHATAQGATITVNTTADPDSGSNCALREAIINAVNNDQSGSAGCSAGEVDPAVDEIVFDPAMVGATITLDGAALPTITEGLTITGPGSDDPAGITLDADEASRIFRIEGLVANDFPVVLSNLTLTNGRTATDGEGGSAMLVESADLALNHVLVTGNSTAGDSSRGGGLRIRDGDLMASETAISDNSTEGALSGGGGLSARNSTVALDTTMFSGNSATGEFSHGGGLQVQLSESAITDSTISGNSAVQGIGGGLFIASSNASLTGTTVSDNTTESAGGNGGGMFIGSSVVALTDITVSDNATSGTFSNGGGLRINMSNVTLTRSIVSGNSTTGHGANGGGISIVDISNVELDGTTVSGNTTAGDGAAGGGLSVRSIGSTSGLFTLAGSTVSGNSTVGSDADGGGLFLSSDDFTGLEAVFVNSTVSGNETAGANADGGGLRLQAGDEPAVIEVSGVTITANAAASASGGGISSEGSVTSANSIIADNGASSSGPDCSGSIASGNFNLIGDQDGCGFAALDGDVLDVDPGLEPLADNGGPTPTHALAADSPAIDAGDPEDPDGDGTCETEDQRGETRPFDGDGDGEAVCDIGAFEVNAVPATADLLLGMTASPDPVVTGQTLTYTIEVTNGGPDVAGDVSVEDLLPADVTLQSTSGCVEDPAGVPDCSLTNTLGADTTVSYTIEVTVDASAGSTVVNQASASTTSVDPIGMNNLDQVETQVIAPAAAGTLQFAQPSYSFDEGDGMATLTVERAGGTTGDVTVDYASADGTASAPGDYGAVADTLTFPDGATTRSLDVGIVDDAVLEGDETFTVFLSGPTGGAVVGDPDTAVVTIRDDGSADSVLAIPATGIFAALILALSMLGSAWVAGFAPGGVRWQRPAKPDGK